MKIPMVYLAKSRAQCESDGKNLLPVELTTFCALSRGDALHMGVGFDFTSDRHGT